MTIFRADADSWTQSIFYLSRDSFKTMTICVETFQNQKSTYIKIEVKKKERNQLNQFKSFSKMLLQNQ